ncbi:MAG TPA: alpha-amylase [Gammaproteobacteria bacterium]|nr:alpha-amylase [Gammaproteobacteria bacterium]|tara:strand:- start:2001 stop:3755 length:1755 start_codon:yes stop_codon:yes gene_type:complete
MIDDNSATIGSETPHQMSQSEYALVQNLTALYGEGGASYLAKRLMAIAMGELMSGPADTQRPPNLLSANDRMLICYGDSIRDEPASPLSALQRFAATHLSQSISTIHVLPFFPSSSDDGFAVIDYQAVRPDLGEWSDINELSEHFDLMFDLVINHCSRENLWFADFIGGRAPGCDYFHEMPSMIGLEKVVRPRNSPLLTDVHTYRGVKRVWTTFSDDQIDLNFANPDVLCEFVHVLFSYIAQGARFIRLDAIAFLWKELGTSSINLEQTHSVVRVLRALIDEMQTQTLLLTETNVPHAENISYFGAQDEAHLVYQFSLAPLLLYSYLFNDGQYLGLWARQLSPPAQGCSFINFIASHDGIGLRPLEGLVPESDIQNLTDKVHERGGYAAMRSGKDGKDTVYELNIALFSAFGGTVKDIPAYVAAHQLMMAFQGIPALYINALVGGLNDLQGVESTGRTRSINRGSWNLEPLLTTLNSDANNQSIIFKELCRNLQLRGAQSAFAPSAQQQVLAYTSSHLWLKREADDQRIFVVASFSDAKSEISVPDEDTATGHALDVLTDETVDLSQAITLAPYQVRWLSIPLT